MVKNDYTVGTYTKLVEVEEQKKKTAPPTSSKISQDRKSRNTYNEFVEGIGKTAKQLAKEVAFPKTKGVKKETKLTTILRYHDTTQPSYQDELVETIRKAVKQLGKEAATYRFTQQEKKSLTDIVYTYKVEGLRTSENEITRISINLLVEDYRKNGKNSILSRVLERLNA